MGFVSEAKGVSEAVENVEDLKREERNSRGEGRGIDDRNELSGDIINRVFRG